MDARKNVFILGLALIAGLSSTARSGDFFTDQGSIWAGGSFSYINENIRGEKNPMNVFMLSPALRFFPARYLVVSPAFSWDLMSQEANDGSSYSSGMLTIGPELGFAFGKNIPVVPYVISGVRYVHNYSSNSYPSGGLMQDFNSGADGYRIPLMGGVMIPIVDGLGIQVEPGFIYNHVRNYSTGQSSDMSVFVISIGLCGVGKRMAISLLNTFTDLMF